MSLAVDIGVAAKHGKESDVDQKMDLSEDEGERPEAEAVTPGDSATPLTPADQLLDGDRLKRKRSGAEERNGEGLDDMESTPSKRLRSETPPPPPPPPPKEATPGAAAPSGAQQLPSGSSVEAGMELSPTMGDVAIEPPPAPPTPIAFAYREGDERYGRNNTDTSPMMFDGMNGTPSESDEAEIDKGNLSIHGLGIGHMSELQVRQGH